jgi:hypothetical protein
MKQPAWRWILGVGLIILASGSGCGPKPTETKSGPAAKDSGSGNPLTAPVDYLGAVGAAQKRAARFADLTPVQQAVQAFQAGEDRLPANLQEIVKEGYLPKLPTAPAGSVLAYDPRTGQVKFVPATGATNPGR